MEQSYVRFPKSNSAQRERVITREIKLVTTAFLLNVFNSFRVNRIFFWFLGFFALSATNPEASGDIFIRQNSS